VLYLVSPEYALRAGRQHEFQLDPVAIERTGCEVFFASVVEAGANRYCTVGTSRALALAAAAPSLEQARRRVVDCARTVPVLEWRRDVGDERYLRSLTRLLTGQPTADGKEPLRPCNHGSP
jgi:phosphoribosylamine-glycine ligase